uniref:Uncharacterized protein n=1 Tax=Arundo donax TaxID=35708 RepID=A0A0A9GVT0_ARUDO
MNNLHVSVFCRTVSRRRAALHMHSGRNDSMEDDGVTSTGASTIFPEHPTSELTTSFCDIAPSTSVSMGTADSIQELESPSHPTFAIVFKISMNMSTPEERNDDA